MLLDRVPEGADVTVLSADPDSDVKIVPAERVRELVQTAKARFLQLMQAVPEAQRPLTVQKINELRARIVAADIEMFCFASRYTHIFKMLTTPEVVTSAPHMALLDFELQQLSEYQQDKIPEAVACSNITQAKEACFGERTQ